MKTFIGKDNSDPSWWPTLLYVGEQGERIVAAHMKATRGWEIDTIGEKRSDYDIKFRHGEKMEIKSNIWVCSSQANITGHNYCFVEIECSGKRSGINVCEAEYFVFYYPFESKIYIARTEDLKRDMKKFHLSTQGGGEGRVRGHLVPRSYFQMEETRKMFWEYGMGDKPHIMRELVSIWQSDFLTDRLLDWSSAIE